MDSNYYLMETERYKKEIAALQFAVETVVRVPGDTVNTENLVQLCQMLNDTRRVLAYTEAEMNVALAKEQATKEQATKEQAANIKEC